MQRTFSRAIITGSTGYVGRGLARRFLKEGTDLVLPIRASGAEDFELRKAALLASLGGTSEQVHVIAADISAHGELHRLPLDADVIVHSAADTRFNIDEATANRVNRDASLGIFQLARRSPNLKNLAYISTVYAAGERAGEIPEQLIDRPQSFANHYERSKWETEQLLASEFGELPWQIHRVATVIADDESGAYSQLNAVHNTLKLLYYGLVSLVPGYASVPIYLVCGDFVEEALTSLIHKAPLHEVFNICHSRNESLTLEQFVDFGFQGFLRDEGFRKRGIQKPLLVDDTSFNILAEGLSGFGSPLLNDAIGSMVPFARQLYIQKDFQNEKVRKALAGYHAPDPAELISRLVGQLIQKRWKI